MVSRELLSLFFLLLVCRVDADILHRAKRGTSEAEETCTDDDIVNAFNICVHNLEKREIYHCIRYQAIVLCMVKQVNAYVTCSEERVREVLSYDHNAGFLQDEYGVRPVLCEQAAAGTTTTAPQTSATASTTRLYSSTLNTEPSTSATFSPSPTTTAPVSTTTYSGGSPSPTTTAPVSTTTYSGGSPRPTTTAPVSTTTYSGDSPSPTTTAPVSTTTYSGVPAASETVEPSPLTTDPALTDDVSSSGDVDPDLTTEQFNTTVGATVSTTVRSDTVTNDPDVTTEEFIPVSNSTATVTVESDNATTQSPSESTTLYFTIDMSETSNATSNVSTTTTVTPAAPVDGSDNVTSVVDTTTLTTVSMTTASSNVSSTTRQPCSEDAIQYAVFSRSCGACLLPGAETSDLGYNCDLQASVVQCVLTVLNETGEICEEELIRSRIEETRMQKLLDRNYGLEWKNCSDLAYSPPNATCAPKDPVPPVEVPQSTTITTSIQTSFTTTPTPTASTIKPCDDKSVYQMAIVSGQCGQCFFTAKEDDYCTAQREVTWCTYWRLVNEGHVCPFTEVERQVNSPHLVKLLRRNYGYTWNENCLDIDLNPAPTDVCGFGQAFETVAPPTTTSTTTEPTAAMNTTTELVSTTPSGVNVTEVVNMTSTYTNMTHPPMNTTIMMNASYTTPMPSANVTSIINATTDYNTTQEVTNVTEVMSNFTTPTTANVTYAPTNFTTPTMNVTSTPNMTYAMPNATTPTPNATHTNMSTTLSPVNMTTVVTTNTTYTAVNATVAPNVTEAVNATYATDPPVNATTLSTTNTTVIVTNTTSAPVTNATEPVRNATVLPPTELPPLPSLTTSATTSATTSVTTSLTTSGTTSQTTSLTTSQTTSVTTSLTTSSTTSETTSATQSSTATTAATTVTSPTTSTSVTTSGTTSATQSSTAKQTTVPAKEEVIEGTLVLTNVPWDDALESKKSAEYKQLNESVTNTLDDVYRNSAIAGSYEEIRDVTFSEGSVVANYEVLLKPGSNVTAAEVESAFKSGVKDGNKIGPYVYDPERSTISSPGGTTDSPNKIPSQDDDDDDKDGISTTVIIIIVAVIIVVIWIIVMAVCCYCERKKKNRRKDGPPTSGLFPAEEGRVSSMSHAPAHPQGRNAAPPAYSSGSGHTSSAERGSKGKEVHGGNGTEARNPKGRNGNVAGDFKNEMREGNEMTYNGGGVSSFKPPSSPNGNGAEPKRVSGESGASGEPMVIFFNEGDTRPEPKKETRRSVPFTQDETRC